MWTIVGAITFIQFALKILADPIDKSWRVQTNEHSRFYSFGNFLCFVLGVDRCLNLSFNDVVSFNSNLDPIFQTEESTIQRNLSNKYKILKTVLFADEKENIDNFDA